jgi:hypothetical protein
MPARVPLDVDLEDRLLYGLTPTRLGYLVISLIVGFALWSSPWAITPLRAGAALIVVATGAVISWGRWRGRRADALLVDIATFTARTHRISINKWLLRMEWRART